MKISIIIPTYNRCENLRLLLDTIRKLRFCDGLECEVLVIDNKSTDSTKQITANYLFSEHPAFRYIFEQEQGKSYALNTGIREARGDILAFTDDDCVPDPYWLTFMMEEFTNDPLLSVLGGRVELYNKDDEPQSIVPCKERIRIQFPWELSFPPLIIGCNMAIRREVLKVVWGFDPLLGPGSKIEAIYEDIDFLYRILRRGFKIAYSPAVLIFHNHGRRSKTEVDDQVRKYLKGRGAFYCKHIFRKDMAIIRMACGDLFSTVTALVKGAIARKRSPYHEVLLPSLFLGALDYYKANHLKEEYYPHELRPY